MAKSGRKGEPKAKRGRAAASGRAAKQTTRSRAGRVESEDSHAELPEGGKLYHRIGEVSRITGVKPYVLRYWESEFRCMSPQKSRSKQRLYRPKDIEIILVIKKLLYQERYTIAGARQKVRELVAAGTVQEWLRERSGQKDPGASRRGAPEAEATRKRSRAPNAASSAAAPAAKKPT